MVGRDVPPARRGRKPAATRSSHARGAGLERHHDAGRGGAQLRDVSVACVGARSSHRRRGWQAPNGADRRLPASGVTSVARQKNFFFFFFLRVPRSGRHTARAAVRELAGRSHPGDRQRRGLVLEFSLAEKLALARLDDGARPRFGWLVPRRLISRHASSCRSRCPRGVTQTRASALCGRKPEKVVIAREVGGDRTSSFRQPTADSTSAHRVRHSRLVRYRRGKTCASCRSSWTRFARVSDTHPRDLEGRIVGEYDPDVAEERPRHRDDGGGKRGRRDRRGRTVRSRWPP